MTEQVLNISRKVPEKITNWIVTGFSINAEHGLAIAEPQQVKVYQDFFIKADFPSSLKVGEVAMLDVQVFNYLDETQIVELTIAINDEVLEIVKEQIISYGCSTYEKIHVSSQRLTVVPRSAGSHIAFVRAVKNGMGNIIIEANGDGVSDKIEIFATVNYEGVTQYKSNPMLIIVNNSLFKQEISIDLPDNVELPAVRVVASVSGNIFGPPLDKNVRFE